jgi:membrane-associated phospholipid phosphatase
MRFFTWAGATGPIVALTIAIAAFVAYKGRRVDALCILLTLPVRLLNEVAKIIIARPRPSLDEVEIILAANGYSFPSGHSSSAVILFGFLAWLAIVRIGTPLLRAGAVLACVATILLIGLSRVYLGAHWPSDVVGGYAFGLLVLLLLIAVHRRLAGIRRPPGSGPPGRNGTGGDVAPDKRLRGEPSYSEHARSRMSERRISEREVRAVLKSAAKVWRDRTGKPVYLGYPNGRRIKVVIDPASNPPHIVTVAD